MRAMFKVMTAAAGLGLLVSAGGVALAQGAPPPNAPPPPPPGDHGPGPQGDMGRGPMDGPRPDMGYMRREMMMRRMEEFNKAAHFHFRKGDMAIDVKCAADESTKACTDATAALLDKLNAATAK